MKTHLFDFINSELFRNTDHLQYGAQFPFPHIVIDNFLKDDVAREIRDSFPKPEDEIWWEYNNPLERKFASDDIRKFHPLIAQVINKLNSEAFMGILSGLTGIEDLQSDPYMHGGGLHLIKPGGKLDMHLDYSIHPKLGLERRINLILYLVPDDWQEEWNGNLELWSGAWENGEPKLYEKEKHIVPKFNRAVIFSTDDHSFHGHPETLSSPEDKPRKSLALYYLTEPRESTRKRTRAQFLARPEIDPVDEETQKFRAERSREIGKY